MKITTSEEKEADHKWAFQNAMTMEFSSQQACTAIGSSIINSIFVVDTMTVRSWCYCDSDKKCPTEANAVAKASQLINDQNNKQPETVRKFLHTFKEPQSTTAADDQNFTILRLYPPVQAKDVAPPGTLQLK